MTRSVLPAFLSVLVLSLVGCQKLRQAIPDPQAQNPAKTEAEKAAEKRSLSPFEILEGTPYRIARVTETEASRGLSLSSSGYSESGSNARNVIVLNAETKESVKLLPKSNFILSRLEKVGRVDEKGKLVKVEALWYLIIRADSNGDQKLDYQDKSAIATSTISGTNYTELIPQVDRVLNAFQAGPTKISVVYELDRKYFVADLDLGVRRVLGTKELPNLE